MNRLPLCTQMRLTTQREWFDNSEHPLKAQAVSQTLAKHCYCHTPVTVESIVTGVWHASCSLLALLGKVICT